MLAGSVCTFQTMALTHKRELQTQATAIYMVSLQSPPQRSFDGK